MNSYRKGDPISGLRVLIGEIMNDQPVFWRNKVQNSGWLMQCKLNWLKEGVEAGDFYHAVRIENPKRRK